MTSKDKIIIPVDPVAKGRPRVGRYGVYTPAKTRNAENEIKQYASLLFQGNMYACPLSVDITFNIKKPKTSKNIYPAVKPDLDNYIKLVCDSLNGIAWLDDSLIVELTARKVYTDKGSIEIKITEK